MEIFFVHSFKKTMGKEMFSIHLLRPNLSIKKILVHWVEKKITWKIYCELVWLKIIHKKILCKLVKCMLNPVNF